MSFLPLYPLPLREREGKGEGEPERRGNLYFSFGFILDSRKAVGGGGMEKALSRDSLKTTFSQAKRSLAVILRSP
jgi:hypothetical protein